MMRQRRRCACRRPLYPRLVTHLLLRLLQCLLASLPPCTLAKASSPLPERSQVPRLLQSLMASVVGWRWRWRAIASGGAAGGAPASSEGLETAACC